MDSLNLDDLRKEIAALDIQLLELVAKRISLARSIGELKQEKGLPVRNLGVEGEVRKRHQRVASELGLDPRAVDSISSILIQEAIEEQASIPMEESFRREVMIVGGAGKMGQWMADLLRSCGHSVHISDPSWKDGVPLSKAAEMDVIVIATPISIVDEVLSELDGLISSDCLLFDIASLKSPFQDRLLKMATRGKVCSVHPMFGPGVRSMYDRNLIFCDCGSTEAVEEAMALLDHHGARMSTIPVTEHDRYMSYVLGMSHAASIAFLSALEMSGISSEEFGRMASTTFRRQIEGARSVGEEDPSLYHEIQRLGDLEGWGSLSAAVERLREAALNEDPAPFREIMEKGRTYLR